MSQIYTSAKLAVLSTCIVPCIAGMAVIYGRYVRKITRKLLDQFAEISKVAEERLGNVKTVKTFCKEDQECKSYNGLLTDALTLGYKDVMARSVFFGLVSIDFSFHCLILHFKVALHAYFKIQFIF